MSSCSFDAAEKNQSPDWSDMINMVYIRCLGRLPEAEAVFRWNHALNKGIAFAFMLQEIGSSQEALARHQELKIKIDLKSINPQDFEQSISIVYWQCLGRRPDPSEINHWRRSMETGLRIEAFMLEVDSSPEAIQYRQSQERAKRDGSAIASDKSSEGVNGSFDSRADLINCSKIVYARILKREPQPDEIEHWVNAMQHGLSVPRFICEIECSQEADAVRMNSITGKGCTDGEFLSSAGQLLYGRGLTPIEFETWMRYLDGKPARREEFVRNFVNAHVEKNMATDMIEGSDLHDASSCMIMGTEHLLTWADWNKRAKELKISGTPSITEPLQRQPATFKHSGTYIVSMIASLYKGKRYLEQFLENITSQSFFNYSELIIIDANSPEYEHILINEYQQRFPNIVYNRVNYRIGIYEAWNMGLEFARGQYITNTNLDDLRRFDSIELQVAVLDQYPAIDVVYQDFFYSLESDLTFEQVEAYGFKSELPIICPHNILAYNSPHNAPMWRKALHDELGSFDTSFRSAGDYEFWARCLAHGKKFRKINTPHVVYYQNPHGISTRPDTKGVEEAHRILTRYSNKLISRALAQPRSDFLASLGLEPEKILASEGKSYYDLIQEQLLRLGERQRG